MDFAALYGACELSEIAVIDLDIAARHGEHHYPVAYDQGVTTQGYTNVTETLVGMVDVKLEQRIKQRRAREDLALDRRGQDRVWAIQADLCVCIAGKHDLMDCTCKSYERALWKHRNESFDMKLANAHLDGLTDGR
jgi:hypothetical protein